MRESHSRASTLAESFSHATRGVMTAFKDERNVRVQSLYLALVIMLLSWLKPPLALALLATATVMLLITAELANSALERLVDLVCPERNPLAGEVKDIAAGAVMLISFFSAATVLLVVKDSLEFHAILGLGGVFAALIHRRFRKGEPA